MFQSFKMSGLLLALKVINIFRFKKKENVMQNMETHKARKKMSTRNPRKKTQGT